MPYGIYENSTVIAQFVTPMTMRSNVPVFISDTLSLKRNIGRRSAQRWELETKLEPLTVGAQNLMAHLVVNGHSEVITILVPQNTGVLKARTSTSNPTCTGAAGASAVTVAGNTGLIPRGTFIKFTNHSKIYMTTADLNGTGSLNIFPTLRVAQNANTFQHRDNVVMSCYYDTDTVTGMVYDDAMLMDVGTVKLIEKV